MSPTEIGKKAEIAASAYLEMRGFLILERNFRRPRCEIDIIAQKDNAVHFVEVKYRRTDDQGSGFDAITSAKLRQMARGAHIWIDETKWHGEYVLSAIEVSGPTFAIMGFIENAF
ncbi:MAG: YraN family protein [Patescibacteria group bacterium]|nr:YraN family protein [Patescibacteria group bacterium]